MPKKEAQLISDRWDQASKSERESILEHEAGESDMSYAAFLFDELPASLKTDIVRSFGQYTDEPEEPFLGEYIGPGKGERGMVGLKVRLHDGSIKVLELESDDELEWYIQTFELKKGDKVEAWWSVSENEWHINKIERLKPEDLPPIKYEMKAQREFKMGDRVRAKYTISYIEKEMVDIPKETLGVIKGILYGEIINVDWEGYGRKLTREDHVELAGLDLPELKYEKKAQTIFKKGDKVQLVMNVLEKADVPVDSIGTVHEYNSNGSYTIYFETPHKISSPYSATVWPWNIEPAEPLDLPEIKYEMKKKGQKEFKIGDRVRAKYIIRYTGEGIIEIPEGTYGVVKEIYGKIVNVMWDGHDDLISTQEENIELVGGLDRSPLDLPELKYERKAMVRNALVEYWQ